MSLQTDISPLTKREREIIVLLANGLTGEQVADLLVLSSETIKTHIRNAMNKLDARTRVHAVVIAMNSGFIDSHQLDPEISALGSFAIGEVRSSADRAIKR